jgi:oxalate decarboxylase/phosphoglucose isomerase-like protein (cupin superfamily)
MRELHWHPNADEWQYYLEGTARMGVFGSMTRRLTAATAVARALGDGGRVQPFVAFGRSQRVDR